MLTKQGNRLVYRYANETMVIEPWGKDSLRVRASASGQIDELNHWALLPREEKQEADITIDGDTGSLTWGRLTATLTNCELAIHDACGKQLLKEYWRGASTQKPARFYALKFPGRQWKELPGGGFGLTYRLCANPGEKLFGMGQYQDGILNKKGATMELAQRNSQATVPFVVSSLGYGFLWNNPAVGSTTFASNRTEWTAKATDQLDFWITAGDTPRDIMLSYANATGTPPMMPEYAMGFWQCKLRYRTQEEVLNIAREYQRRGVKLDILVIDFFHWTQQGEWKFDPRYFPDPDAMIAELKSYGIETMVSIWPTVDTRSENYQEMLEKGYLVHCKSGVQVPMQMLGEEGFFDPTNPGARAYVWDKVLKNYYAHGIKLFWLDVAEPEYTSYDYEHYRYAMGPVEKVGNIYPVLYARTFYDGLVAQGVNEVVSLARCAWAGSQRYGALVWSGDIETDFVTLRNQFAAGLSMAMAGIPWWTTDIGGFHGGGEQSDPAYRELIIRWFQWGTYCPVMRLHGVRPNGPTDIPEGECASGGDNEIWSYGEQAYEIFKALIERREEMRPYIRELMRETHETGAPVMRPLFYEFPADENAWDCEDAFMFGGKYLVAPVMEAGIRERRVYLPAGADWTEQSSGQTYPGGQVVMAAAPLEVIPVFERK